MNETTQLFKDWIVALRSGRYPQGKDGLNIEGMFCCLGVACDLEGRFPWVKGEIHGRYRYYGKNSTSLDHTTMTALGISNETEIEVMAMNDSGSTFAQIADYLEKKAAEGTL